MDRKIPLIYDTLSDCINDPNIVGGMVVKTLGENTIDDGNGRVYKVYDSSMGVVYDRNKHIQLAKSGTFMGKIEDSPLYEGLRDANREIEYLKTQSSIADLTHVERCYNTESELKTDPKVTEGMIVKTFGKNITGDGLGRTYEVIAHDPTQPYAKDEVQLLDFNIAAKIIDASYAEAVTEGNVTDIDEIKSDLASSVLASFDDINAFKNSPYPKDGMAARLLGKNDIGDGLGGLYKVYGGESPAINTDIELARVFNTFSGAEGLDQAYDLSSGMRARTLGKDAVEDGQGALYTIYEAETITGYYFDGAFYTGLSHETLILPKEGKIYQDITSGQGNKKYTWDGVSYSELIGDIELTASKLHAKVITSSLYARFVKENAEEEATVGELATQVDGLTTALGNTNNRVEEVNNRVTDTNITLNELRVYTYNNLNDLLFQVNDPSISDWKHFRYFDVEKDPITGEVLSQEFIIAIEGTSNGLKHIIIPAYEYPEEAYSILGFYNGSEFYKDAKHTTVITPESFIYFIDLTAGQNNAMYIWDENKYKNVVRCYFNRDNEPFEDSDLTIPITPVAGTIYMSLNRVYEYIEMGPGFTEMNRRYDLESLVGGGGGSGIPDEKHLFKEVRREVQADVTVEGPLVTVDVLGWSAEWIRPLVLDHFLEDPEPEPDERPIVNGYYYEGHFYTTSEHVAEIQPEIDTIYVDLTTGSNLAEYIWNGEGYELLDEDEYDESIMHFFEENTVIMLNSDSKYPVTVTYKTTTEEYTDPDTQETYTETIPHYVFKATRAPETRVVYYV